MEDEHGLRRNEAAFAEHCLLPRCLVDVSSCDQSTSLFGRTHASPFGIALFRHEADVMLARAAAEAQIAFILRQAEEGTAVAEVCRKAGISDATFYIYGRLSRCKRFE